MKQIYIIISVLFMLSYACKHEPPGPPIDPYNPEPYALKIPVDFPEMPIPEFNPMTVEGVSLGRMLYYDDVLSMNGLACASCHIQQNAFSTPGPGPTGTAVLPHINLGWNPAFGWAGGEHVLDHVALADLEEGNVFLNANNDSILARLKRHPKYPEMFRKAFGIDMLNVALQERKEYISYALTQFMRTQISGDSRFDKFMRGEEGGNLTASEYKGYGIFFSERGDCFHCHGLPLFTNNSFNNNGLDSVFQASNLGRFAVTGDSADLGKFRAPTLRNIELTAPYMHDGRFQTLEEVVEFYNSQVHTSATLDPIMTKPGKENGLRLLSEEKQDLVNFLKTLTDTAFIGNRELGSPF